MNVIRKPQLTEFIVAIVLLLGALVGFLQSLKFPGRAGMWPTFVMVALLLFTGLHFLNLLRVLFQSKSGKSLQPDSQN